MLSTASVTAAMVSTDTGGWFGTVTVKACCAVPPSSLAVTVMVVVPLAPPTIANTLPDKATEAISIWELAAV